MKFIVIFFIFDLIFLVNFRVPHHPLCAGIKLFWISNHLFSQRHKQKLLPYIDQKLMEEFWDILFQDRGTNQMKKILNEKKKHNIDRSQYSDANMYILNLICRSRRRQFTKFVSKPQGAVGQLIFYLLCSLVLDAPLVTTSLSSLVHTR